MIVKTLVENTSLTPEFGHRHGLSLYIETAAHKLLFDVGEDGLFLENARKLNVSIEDVDMVILSHGHYDHGGGLGLFLAHNSRAKIYARKNAFDRHLGLQPDGSEKDIGVDPALKNHPRVVLTGPRTEIAGDILLFSDIRTGDYHAAANDSLLAVRDGAPVRDDFTHEQNLLLRDGGKWFLFSGCSHRGVVNIKRRAAEILGREPDVCVGGFHLYSPSSGTRESDGLVTGVARALAAGNAQYYTCHCTGPHAYQKMRETLGPRLNYLPAGSVLDFQ